MTAEIIPARGRIYMADLGRGEKPYLAVSNDARNRQLQDFLAVRITTAVKPDLMSIVELFPADPVVGRVLCDDIVAVFRDEIRRDVGAVCAATMSQVAVGLRFALTL
jgi:mRNA interferase MazF